jgi:carbon monoxide dehydrogenase subunit G
VRIIVQHVFPVNRQELWDLLLDSKRLAQCIPGCESLEEVAPGRYTATLKIGVASIKGTYVGTVEISEQQPPSHYRLSIEGSAKPGFVRGVGSMDLAEAEGGKTQLAIDAEAEVGGLLASVGQRFLSGIAKQMIERFCRNVEQRLEAGGEITAEAAQ